MKVLSLLGTGCSSIYGILLLGAYDALHVLDESNHATLASVPSGDVQFLIFGSVQG